MSIFAVPKQRFWCRGGADKESSFHDRKRRDAGVVDRAALEMRCTGNCTGGSNPSLSAAKIDYQSITEKAHSFTHTNVKTVRFLHTNRVAVLMKTRYKQKCEI